MAVKVAINGFGRIGRLVLRAMVESGRTDVECIAINDLADVATSAHLFRYDSVHGRFPGEVEVNGNQITIKYNGRTWGPITVSAERDPTKVPYQGVDVAMECTGIFASKEKASALLQAGAKKVLISAPGDNVDATIVYGVNHQTLRAGHTIISNASCTTNCIVPVIELLQAAFGVEHGVITTIHSAMNDQPVLDAYHHTDLRKTRSAFQSIIPVDTGLARGIDRILPALAGRFEAQAMRVPVVNVSAIDLSVLLGSTVTRTQVNDAIKQAAAAFTPGVLGWTEEPLASCDFNHDSRSAIVDLSQTRLSGGRLLKVLVWFDNEWGFANRMLDTATHLARL
jgi:glyceraldehyde 3-phosphate dehydrogenase/D-erythrose 4-phosphate dehydrogenase